MDNPEKAILLVNLGSPKSPNPPDVSQYLKEFLMDKHVINLPFLLRWLLVHGIIAPFRHKKSAHAYSTIWSQNPSGSPLVLYTEQINEKVKRLCEGKYLVEYAMRYGEPSIESKIKKLQQQSVTSIGLVPLYPQYANSTFYTVIERTKKALSNLDSQNKIDLKILEPFYNHPSYLSALFANMEPYISSKNWDHLVLSFHGLPVSHLKQTEGAAGFCAAENYTCCHNIVPENSKCYRAQCYYISKAISEKFKIPEDKFTLCFQSRLGRAKWVEPYTVEVIEKLARKGVKRILSTSPSFVADCLETLEEMAIQNAELFKSLGGESFVQIPALNADDAWAQCLNLFSSELLG